MDCPEDGVAAVHAHDSLAENVAAEQMAAAGVADLELDADHWRREVASRMERYRARRKPRGPRYPSLRLPFDPADSWVPVSASALAVSASATPTPQLTPETRGEQDIPHLVNSHPQAAIGVYPEPELFTNVIEFPRSAAVPVYHTSELAEPVFEWPRIVEAPEVLPPPPAMGGILIEPARDLEKERRAAIDLVLPTASLPRRMLAGLLDSLVLAGGLAGFGAMFAWVNPQRPPMPVMVMAVMIVSVLLWVAYEFLFTVYTGSTPGLRLARLRLAGFDGSPVSRRTRRWRVLASYLSAFSLGLGYLWSVLDEDGLCWHDRMTRTHLS
jgi:uncharacterized RDD family membrane protein YckC